MKIIQEIKDSVYNPNYYKSLPTSRSLGSSIKYLAKLSLLAAFVSVFIISFYIPSLTRNLKEGVSSAVAGYPDDLVVSVKEGAASINKPEPYIVPNKWVDKVPPETLKNNQNLNQENIIVIDTTKPFSLEQFKTYSAFAWLTKTEIVMLKGTDNQMQIVPLSTLGNFELTKPWILDKEATLYKMLPWMTCVLIVIIFFALCFANFAGTLIILFLYAFIIWLIAKLKKVELSYKNSYKIGIHAMTLLILAGIFVRFLGSLDNFFIKLLVLLVIVYFNFFKETEKKTTVVA